METDRERPFRGFRWIEGDVGSLSWQGRLREEDAVALAGECVDVRELVPMWERFEDSASSHDVEGARIRRQTGRQKPRSLSRGTPRAEGRDGSGSEKGGRESAVDRERRLEFLRRVNSAAQKPRGGGG